LLDGVQGAGDLGECFGSDLYTREVDFLVGTEWAETVEDIVWRRTKVGLRLTANEINHLSRYMARLEAVKNSI